MECSSWLGMENSCWPGLDPGWSDESNWAGINPMASAGGIRGGGGGAGSAEWSGISPGWVDPVGYADKNDEWGIPDNWGEIEPPSCGHSMLMENSGFEGMSGCGMFGDFGGFKNCNAGSGFMPGGGFMPRGDSVVDDPASMGGSHGGVGMGIGGGGGGNGGGLETDPIDFDIDGLIAAGGGGGGSGGGANDVGSMVGVGPATDCFGAWCPGPSCCQPAGVGHFAFM